MRRGRGLSVHWSPCDQAGGWVWYDKVAAILDDLGEMVE